VLSELEITICLVILKETAQFLMTVELLVHAMPTDLRVEEHDLKLLESVNVKLNVPLMRCVTKTAEETLPK
jgi:hypothetical protein